ncbi:hypothetical protein D1007_36601 [Hordeum vulgare]|nr:hypothetical protein D1007_36601 [Hordeum vulgare]
MCSIWRSKLESSLVPQHAGYIEFSSEIMKELEGVINKVDNALEEECRDLLSLAETRIFIHLLLRDPHFEFAWVMGPVPEESHGNMATTMRGHVCMLIEKFSYNDDE